MDSQKFFHKKEDFTADDYFSGGNFNRFEQHPSNKRCNQNSRSFSRHNNYANRRTNTWTGYNNYQHHTRKPISRSTTRQFRQSRGRPPPQSRGNRPQSRGSRPQPRVNRPQSRGSRLQSRASSPLYGSEEYTQRKVQETSELIKQQLLNGEDKGLSTLDIQLPHKDDVVKGVENDTDTSVVIISDDSVKKTNTSVPKFNKNFTFKEICDKFMYYLTHLNYNKMTNLVNLEHTVYDSAIHKIQQKKRLEFSRGLRDVCLNRASENTEAINSLIPDFNIKIDSLPPEILTQLRVTLNINQEDLETSWNCSGNVNENTATYENLSGEVCNRSESPDVEVIDVKPECIVLDEASYDDVPHENMKCKTYLTENVPLIKKEPCDEIPELCPTDPETEKIPFTLLDRNSDSYEITNKRNAQPEQEVEQNCKRKKIKPSATFNIDQGGIEASESYSDNVELAENAATYKNIFGEVCNRSDTESTDVEMIEVKPECIVLDEASYDDVSHENVKCETYLTENVLLIKKEPCDEIPELCPDPEIEKIPFTLLDRNFDSYEITNKRNAQPEHEVEQDCKHKKIKPSATFNIDQGSIETSESYSDNVQLAENAITYENISAEVCNRSESTDVEMIEVKPECVVDEASYDDVSHQNMECRDNRTENIDVIQKESFEEVPALYASDQDTCRRPDRRTGILSDHNSDSYEIINKKNKQLEHEMKKNCCESKKLKYLDNSEKSDNILCNIPVTDEGLMRSISYDVVTPKPLMVTSEPSLTDDEETVHNEKHLHSTDKFVSVYTQTDFSSYNQSPKTLNEALKTMFEIDSEIQKLTRIRQQLFSNLGSNEINENNLQTERLDDTGVSKETPKEISIDELVAEKKKELLNITNSPKSDHGDDCISVESVKAPLHFELENVLGKVVVITTFRENIIVGTDDGKVLFFSLYTGALLSSVKVVPSSITCINVSKPTFGNKNDTTMIKVFIGAVSNGLNILRYNSTKFEKPIDFDAIPMCLERAWGHLFIGCRQGFLFRYSLKGGKIKYGDRLSQSDILVLSATFEGCRKVLLVGSRQCPVTIRDAMSGLHMRTLENVVSPTVYSLLLSKGIVFCGTVAHDLLAFSFYSGALEDKFVVGNAKGISVLKMFNNVLFASCHDGNIYVHNTRPRHFIEQINGPGGVILAMELIETKIIVSTMSCKFVALDIPSNVLKYCLKQ